MSRVAEMGRLTEDLAHSHEERMAGLAARQADVHGALLEIRNERLAAATTFRQELAKETDARRGSVAGTLAEFQRGRVAMGADQRSRLARVTADRQRELRNLRSHDRDWLREVHVARLASQAPRLAALHQARIDLSQQVGRLIDEMQRGRLAGAAEQRSSLTRGRDDLASQTASFLGEVRGTRVGMAKAQQESLEAGRATLQSEVSVALNGFRANRSALAENLAEFAGVWQAFTQGMATRRNAAGPNGPAAEASAVAPPTAAPVSVEVVAAGAPPATATPPQAVGTRPTAEAIVESPRRPSDEEVFSYLADHPDGVRLVELEEHYGIPRIRLVQTLSRLIEENKARKDDERRIYFAT